MADVTLSHIGERLRSMLGLLWIKAEGMPAKVWMANLPQGAPLSEHACYFDKPSDEASARFPLKKNYFVCWLE